MCRAVDNSIWWKVNGIVTLPKLLRMWIKAIRGKIWWKIRVRETHGTIQELKQRNGKHIHSGHPNATTCTVGLSNHGDKRTRSEG